MNLLEKMRNYIKFKFGSQKFEDYKTKDDQIVTGELEVGKELLDLESMTPIEGEVVIENKKCYVEKGIITKIEDVSEDIIEDESKEDEESVDEKVVIESKEEEVIETVEKDEKEEEMEEVTDELIIDENVLLKTKIESLNEIIDSLKKEIESLKSDKEELSKEFEQFKNVPVKEVFKTVQKPVKMNAKESLANSLKELRKSLD